MPARLKEHTKEQVEKLKQRCVLMQDHNIAFFNIPKNASTSLRTLSNNGRMLTTTKLADMDCRVIAILRDPVTRFASAMNMFAYENLFRNDEHLAQQYEFLGDVPHDRIDFFYYNKEILSDIKKHYNINIDEKIHENKTGRGWLTITDPYFIKEMYAEDYKLINSVNFVNKGPSTKLE